MTESQGGSSAKRQRVSNKMCDLFEMGGCTRGDSCPFAHFESELVKFVQGNGEAPLPQGQSNAGSGDSGGFGGSLPQFSSQQPPPPQQQQQQQQQPQQPQQWQPIPSIQQQQVPQSTPTATGPAPVGRIPPAGAGSGAPNSPKEICWFHERGWCTKGDSCKFSHDLSSRGGLAVPGAGVAQRLGVSQDSGQQAALWAAGGDALGGLGALGALGGGTSSDDLAQTALLYQQAVAGLQPQADVSAAQDCTAIVASTAVASTDATAAAAAAGYDEQTIAALYQYQALQATLMAQGGAADYGCGGGSQLGEMDPATNAAYSAAWAAALSNAGLLPSTASALTAATSSAGTDTAAAIAAAAAAAAEYRQTLLLASQQTEGLGKDAAAAAVAGVATTRANYKMQLCKFFSEGKCVKGAFCPYAHGNEEVLAASLRAARVEAAMREGSRNDVCYDFRDRGKCRFGITCKFSHNLEKL